MTIYDPQPISDEIPFWEDPIIYTTNKRVEILKALLETKCVYPTGSRHIETPAKMGTDDDYLIYIPNSMTNMDVYRDSLVKDGWIDCLDQAQPDWEEKYKEENVDRGQWGAFRKGEVNIVVYLNEFLYEASKHATSLCQKLNVKDKEKRIRIFRWYKFDEPLQEGDLSWQN